MVQKISEKKVNYSKIIINIKPTLYADFQIIDILTKKFEKVRKWLILAFQAVGGAFESRRNQLI
jgi:hypothetical protein